MSLDQQRVGSNRRIAVEVGGTFTDWVVADGGVVRGSGKVLSTPAAPEIGVLTAIRTAEVTSRDLSSVVHGSTVATNAILERKGTVTALVTTSGFADVLTIRRMARDRVFDFSYRHPNPLVRKDLILEVEERVGADGSVLLPLAADDVAERIDSLTRSDGVQAVAIVLLHSYANPRHELAIESQLRQRLGPRVYLSRSSQVAPEFREYERASTTVVNAYLKPVLSRYLSELESELEKEGFQGSFNVVQCNGGTVPASMIREHTHKMVLSGPAAGAIAAARLASRAGFRNLITLDMGGTSTDVCLVRDGEPQMTAEHAVGGHVVKAPSVDIVSVGAGGGSVASVDEGGILAVGPESAGADPGPVCYGRGGQQVTVTDANAFMGYIRPERFSSGLISLDVESVGGPLCSLGERLNFSDLETAAGIRRLVNATMASAVRLVSVERGHDPKDYVIVAFGGGGPLHAAELADELGIGYVLVPYDPGKLSAYGLLLADTKQHYTRTRVAPADSLSLGALTAVFDELIEEARTEFESFGVDWSLCTIAHTMDLRFAGQAFELSIPVTEFLIGQAPLSKLPERFAAYHRQRYGHASAEAEVEVVNIGIIVRFPSELSDLAAPAVSHEEPVVSNARLYLGADSRVCPFVWRESLAPGYKLEGPGVVEEATATTFVPEGWFLTVDEFHNLLLQKLIA